MKKTILLLLCAFTLLSVTGQHFPPSLKKQMEQKQRKQENPKTSSGSLKANGGDNPSTGEPDNLFEKLTYNPVSFPYVNNEAFTELNSEVIPGMGYRAMGFSFTLDKDAYTSFVAIEYMAGDYIEYDGRIEFRLFDGNMKEIDLWVGYNKEVIPAGDYKLLAIQRNYGRTSKLAFDVQLLDYQTIALPVNAMQVDFAGANTIIIDGVKTKLFTFNVSSDSEALFDISDNYDVSFTLYNQDMETVPVLPSASLTPGNYYLWLWNRSETENTAMLTIFNQQVNYSTITVPYTGNITFNDRDLLFGARAKAYTFTIDEPEVFSFSGSNNDLYFQVFNASRSYHNSFYPDANTGMLQPGTYFMWVLDASEKSGNYSTSFSVTEKEFYKTIDFPHNAEYVFSNQNTMTIDGNRTLGFTFNLTEASLVEFSGLSGMTNGRVQFRLFNSLMEEIAISDYWGEYPLSSQLLAGTYYLHVSYNDYWEPEDFKATLNFKKLNSVPVTGFPFYQEIGFNMQNSIQTNGQNRAIMYSFALSEPGDFIFSTSFNNITEVTLFDADMNRIYIDATNNLPAGEYYLVVEVYYAVSNTTDISIQNVAYEPITFPYSQSHIYDENTIRINSSRTKFFTFTLTEYSVLRMSDSEDRIDFNLYDEDMNSMYYYEEDLIPAGKYYLQARDNYSGGEVFATDIHIDIATINHESITLPYNREHTFSGSNTTIVNWKMIKGFTFTLQQEQRLLFATSNTNTWLELYDGEMNPVDEMFTAVKTLPAGTYYLWAVADNDYAEPGKDMVTNVVIEQAPELTYTDITLPYSQAHTFGAGNTVSLAGNRTKLYRINKTDDADYSISSTDFGAFFFLFDEDMYNESGGFCASFDTPGTYYLWVDDRYYQGTGDFSTTIKIQEPQYKSVILPYDEVLPVNEERKYFSFTLAKRTAMDISCVVNDKFIYSELVLYDQDGKYVADYNSSSVTTLDEGTYSVKAYFSYEGNYGTRNNFAEARMIIKPVENIVYTPITLDYSQQHVFNDANTQLITGNRTLNFKFTLTEETILNVSSFDSGAYFTLMDADMKIIRVGHLLSPKVPAGDYYLRADDRYFNSSTESPFLTTTLYVKATHLSYQEVTLPYVGQYGFDDENTVRIDDAKTRGFTFNVEQEGEYMFRIYNYNANFVLFNENMQQITDLTSEVIIHLGAGKYYLHAIKSYYPEDDVVTIIFGRQPMIISVAPGSSKVIVSQTASQEDIKVALGEIILTGTADNGQTTIIDNDKSRWIINSDETLATYEVWGGNGFVLNNTIFVTVAIEKSAPALPVILSLTPERTSISVPEGASENTVLRLLAGLTITGTANNGETPGIPNYESDWTIAANGLSATFRPQTAIVGYSYAEGLSTAVVITRTALPQIVSLTASSNSINVEPDATDGEVKELLTGLTIRGHANNNQTIVFSNIPEAWTIAGDGLSAKYEPTAEFPGYTYAENLSVTVAIVRSGSGIPQGTHELMPFIYTVNRTIHIKGIDFPTVEVFDISGRLITKEKTNAVTVQNTGVYLVKVEGKMIKVIVR